MSRDMKFTIALAQIDSVIGDVKKNVKKHLEYIRRAKEGGADLIVFPELGLSGYSIKDITWDAAINTDDTKVLSEMRMESNDIAIIFGCVEESNDFGIYNSAFFLEKGKVAHVHRKVYPPTYGMFEEMRYFSQGKTVRACTSSLGRIGVLICEDL